MVGESEFTAGVCSNHAVRVRQVAGVYFVHIGDAGDFQRNGAGARAHRNLHRDFLHRLVAQSRNWNPARAGAQGGDVLRMMRQPLATLPATLSNSCGPSALLTD